MKVDKLMIDSHKLMYHSDIISKWIKGESIYPIHIEIAPSNGCNHRCIFCAYDFTGYFKKFLNTKALLMTLKEAHEVGTKSIMLAGEGEPLLHPEIKEIIKGARDIGLDIGLQTNGVLATKDFVDSCIKDLSYIKFSVDAGKAKTHKKIHRCSINDFDTIISNIKYAIEVRNSFNYSCKIGVQMLILNKNIREINKLIKILKNIGVDYLVLKPLSRHPNMKSDIKTVSKSKFKDLYNAYRNIPWIEVRLQTYEDIELNRCYNTCYGLDFLAWIDSSGDMYICSSFLGNKDYIYGNIYEKSFKEIWDNRKKFNIDVNKCRKGCRAEKINKYLWNIKNPPLHKNFI